MQTGEPDAGVNSLLRVSMAVPAGYVHKTSFLRTAGSESFWEDLSMRSAVLQAVEALDASGDANVIFAGDLNWQPADGALPLTDGWCADRLDISTVHLGLWILEFLDKALTLW